MNIKNLAKLQYSIPIGVFFLLVVFVSSVFAVGKPNSVGKPEGAGTNSAIQEVKMKACQGKEKAIKKRTEQLVKLTLIIQEKFDAIAERIKKYYTSKMVPDGKTVDIYDSLVADIQTKKEAVQTALTSAKGNAESFACDGNDPKGQLTRFKGDMQTVKAALRDYRVSIKKLIAAVRLVSGMIEDNDLKSPKPTNAGEKND